jgi:hypothetical protein
LLPRPKYKKLITFATMWKGGSCSKPGINKWAPLIKHDVMPIEGIISALKACDVQLFH